MFAVRHNLEAKVAPTPNDDELDGYAPTSLWMTREDDRARVWINAHAEQTKAVWTELTASSGVTRFVHLDDVPKDLSKANGYWFRVQNGALILTKPHHYETRQARAYVVNGTWYTGNPNSAVWDTSLGSDRISPTSYFGVEHKGFHFGAAGEVHGVRLYAHTAHSEAVVVDWRLCRNSRSNGKSEVKSAVLGEVTTTLVHPGKMYVATMELKETAFGPDDSLVLAWRRVDGDWQTCPVELEVAFDLTFG